MKKILKTISLVLVFILMFTMTMPAFAAGTKAADYPEVYVHGFATGEIYTEIDGVVAELGVPDTEFLTTKVKEELVPAALTFAADGDTRKLGTAISGVINEAFADWFNNPDGSPANNSGVRFVYPSKAAIRNSARTYFRYDWRGDPVEIAKDLSAYIDYVLECTGKDKVALTAHSLGNVIVLTYLSMYGYDKVMGYVIDTPAINGLTIVGELFSGKMNFNGYTVETLFKMIIGETGNDALLTSIVDIFTMAGINDSISELINSVYDELGIVIMEKTIFPLFGSWLSIWAMIPDEFIDEAMSYSFESGAYPENYDDLKVKVEEYNEKVRRNKKDTLLGFDEVGRVAVISRYGYSALPMTEEYAIASDSLIETRSTSLGATTAPFGEYFSDEYLKGKDMKYISPDKTIDASTCLFPEKTWFIKNLSHHEPYLTKTLYKQLILGDEEVTCETSELSRFLVYDEETEILSEDKSEPVRTEKLTVFQRIFNFVKALIDKLLALFKK